VLSRRPLLIHLRLPFREKFRQLSSVQRPPQFARINLETLRHTIPRQDFLLMELRGFFDKAIDSWIASPTATSSPPLRQQIVDLLVQTMQPIGGWSERCGEFVISAARVTPLPFEHQAPALQLQRLQFCCALRDLCGDLLLSGSDRTLSLPGHSRISLRDLSLSSLPSLDDIAQSPIEAGAAESLSLGEGLLA
jgi:hypothetical protein